MEKETDTLEPRIVIKNTIDGVAVEQPARTKAAKKNPKAPKAVGNARPDPYIWGIYIMLLLVSVIELFSASSSEVSASNVYMPLIRHGIFLVIGLGFVILLQNRHYAYFGRFAYFAALLSLALLVMSNFFGVSINGAQRAIKIAGFTIQPPEIVKLTVVVLLAKILGKNQEPRGVTNRGVIEAAIVVVVFSAFLFKNGLTNTILLFGVSLAMFLIGGMKWKKFFTVVLVYVLCGGMLYAFKQLNETDPEDEAIELVASASNVASADAAANIAAAAGSDGVQLGRSKTWIERVKRYLKGVKPDDEITDENRQVFFANFAQANGGVFGQGPGNSRESARLPLAFSDYIFSIIVEDTGLVGGLCLLLLYLFLLARAGRIAYHCSRAFPAFLIMGCAVLIVFQALVHMAIVTGLFPVSGQPLPLISKGGTSIIVMSIAIGIMLSVSRFAVTNGDRKQMRAELKDLPEDMQAANYSTQTK